MQIIAAMAEFKQDLLIERTHSGIARAKAARNNVSANVHVHHVHILLFPKQPTVKIFNLSKHNPLLHRQVPTGG